MFSPQGNVERVYTSGSVQRPTTAVHLLVGKRAQVPSAVANPLKANWRAPSSLWVSISPQAGQVTTTENAPVPRGIADAAAGIATARRFAQQGQAIGTR